MSIRSAVANPVHGFYLACELACAFTGLPLVETVVGFLEWMSFCVTEFC